MNTVIFDDFDSFDDFGLILNSKEITFPVPKTSQVTADGINGVIDLTEALTGSVQYNNRTLTFTFTMKDPVNDWYYKISDIAEKLHGKKINISISEDPTYYYIGRCKINSFKSDKNLAVIVIDCDCDPFKYSRNTTSEEDWLWDPFDFENDIIRFLGEIHITSENNEVEIIGGSIATAPVFFVSALNSASTVTINDGSPHTLSLGRNKFFDIKIGKGQATLKFTGDCILTIQYAERRL